jgi:sugar/nucleoside kinase (ribokinase family)
MKSINIVGNLQLDVLASPIDALPIPGGDTLVERIDVRIAGAAGNASLTLHALGGKQGLFSMLGDDLVGRWLYEDLIKMGLAKDLLVVPGGVTAISIAVESENRERAFYTVNGVLERVEDYMSQGPAASADFVLYTGYFSNPGMFKSGGANLLNNVRANGGTSLFDTGWDPDNWSTDGRERVLHLAGLTDYFLPNETEASALTGISNPIEAARALGNIAQRAIIVKMSDKGIFYLDRNGNEIIIPVKPAKVIDSTGAGDSFAASLAFCLARDEKIEDALAFATKVATMVVSRPSANRYPSFDEVK